MPILTLTTDWGLRDHYLASFKGELISLMPALQMIDISHEVGKFDTIQAAFIVQNSYRKFPPGTMHFISVSGNENIRSENPFVIVRANGQYLIGEDNGIFTLILGKDEREIVGLPLQHHCKRSEVRDTMLTTIKKIFDGTEFDELGKKKSALEESYFAQPIVDDNTMRGTIIYIDEFGNAIVNITRDLFSEERRDRNFIMHFRKLTYSVTEISNTYEDVEVGEILALFNQDGFLEIAINKESASKLLGLKILESIRIEFDDSQVG